MNPLSVLELSPGCSLEDARAKWRQLVLQLHPDHNKADPKRFLEVQEAYEAIRSDPTILDIKKPVLSGIVKVSVFVSIEDFYLLKEIPVRISRQVFCKHCAGTGSETRESGICSHCEGLGHITSSVLKLMNRSSTCPACEGVGVLPQNICSKCLGARYEADVSLRKIKLTTEDYHKKAKILKEAGHQTAPDIFNNAFVVLNIKPDSAVSIEDTYFRTSYKILPVQRIIGDIATITIFGRSLKFKIDKNATETTVEDKIAPGITQLLRIMFVETPPVITEDTVELYKQILAIEKQTSL
jgi:DnaJ-class molecular chaperone